MARTKHTDPPHLRAGRRVWSPRAPRGTDDPSSARLEARFLKELGLVDLPAASHQVAGSPTLPRITRTRPRPGFIHPLDRADIRRGLEWLGPIGRYGVSSIELRHRPMDDDTTFLLARYRAPDTVLLFEQPAPPWTMQGRVHVRTRSVLERAGARIQESATTTVVSWPGHTLRSLLLFDGLFHEIGHHMIQQYEGKRTERKMRTSDHERRADAFARECRRSWPMTRSTDRLGRLVGDGIEDPRNARALLDAASMFSIPVVFRDTFGLSARWDEDLGRSSLPTVDTRSLLDDGAPIVAIENARDAESVFGARLRGRSSVVVGNERKGIGHDVKHAATRTLQIPTSGQRLNTLNVAAAAAVALYFLSRVRPGRARATTRPDRHRPTLVLLAVTDHVEAGSALRSAAALGWRTVGVDDRHHVWFDTRRPIRTEGRAAARSHRSALHVVRLDDARPAFEQVTVASTSVGAPPLDRVHLGTGPTSALVLPDERGIDHAGERWDRLGASVRFARIDLPASIFDYRYRLTASIAIAEAARQVGVRRRGARPPTRQRLRYDSLLRTAVPEPAQELDWDELAAY